MNRDALTARFEAAADAIVTGDERALDRLLREEPALIHARSTRAHRATLLHYVAANGVEDVRQRTPGNAPAIARRLLSAGAEVDALADSYGGGPDQTPLTLLLSSVHPARSGLQRSLAAVLLDAGARLEGLEDDGSPLLTALAHHYPSAAELLVQRGARVDTVVAAAGLGRAAPVRRFLDERGDHVPDRPLARLKGMQRATDPRAHLERALIWAAAFGHTDVVDLLADRNVSLSATDEQGFTPLHWAVVRARVPVIESLLERRAPLEGRNVYGGTVLATALWASVNAPCVFTADGVEPIDHLPVIELLLAAGARVDALSGPSGNAEVDSLLARHRAS